MSESSVFRRIKSFVRRGGRMTASQQHAYDRLSSQFCLKVDEPISDCNRIFEKPAPLTVEIGFGMGRSLSAQAKEQPEQNFLGIEVHKPGVGALLQAIQAHDLKNVCIIEADAVEVLNAILPAASVDCVQIFFPDPWTKKRHHKRRLIQPGFMNLLVRVLKPGAMVHLATDWTLYAEHMLTIFSSDTRFKNQSPDNTYMPDTTRFETKFELRGKKLGYDIFDLQFVYTNESR